LKTENLPTLKINKLKTQEQYNKAKENNKINDNELYLVPDETEEMINALGEALNELSSKVNENNNSITESISNLEEKDTQVENNAKSYTDNAIESLESSSQTKLNKKADLDDNGLVLTSQLPSYVDDVINSYIATDSTEFSSTWLQDSEGNVIVPETGKIYLIITEGDYQNKQYRWSGTVYALCNPSDVNSVNGKTGIVELTAPDVGAEPEGAESRANAYTDNTLIPINEALANTYNKKEVDTKITLFHATLDPITTLYIKDSGDFTYADVLATENCKIEASFGNVTIILNKEVIRNIEPDPVAGRYVEFSAILRNGPTTVKVFLFVYDPENLPTDPESVAVLENWGDSQYCGIAVQHIVIGDFLDNDIAAGRNNTINAPSTKAAGDYTDSQCGAVMDYMQTTFAANIMALVADAYGPHIIYDNPTGFEANNKDVGSWHLTGLDLTPYKRLKFYVKAGGDSNDNRTPMHIVEMHLDDRCKNSIGFTAGHTSVNPNNRNRIHCVTFAVNEAKTAVQFVAANSLYGTASTSSSGGRYCYLIEGYKN
jgi:hypothetical protein